MSEYICPLHENVERTHVRYPNRYGLMLAGDLYMAKDMDKTKPQMALIVGAPYGGVKEQGPCVYANELAQRGFVVLTFDPCYMGESAGEPRHVSSPDLFSDRYSSLRRACFSCSSFSNPALSAIYLFAITALADASAP